jgi:hypothetical protein
MVFVTGTVCVYCEVRTKSLNNVQVIVVKQKL